MHRRTHSRAARGLAIGLPLALAGAFAAIPSSAEADDSDQTRLYLVTLDGSGLAGYSGALPAMVVSQMHGQQENVLNAVEAPEPTYTWTSALNGFAVELTADQADEIAQQSAVALVEPDSIRPLASTETSAVEPRLPVAEQQRHGGAGQVIGVIDTGIAPDSPLFADVPGLGPEPRFSGSCESGGGWTTGDCNTKVIGASWYVDGFGADNVRAASSLSPRDTDGHGTAMAAIAAGNADVSVRVRGQELGDYAGTAPEARLAIYKACWSAPDPSDDGCSAADLVAAIDQATSDGVDVLSLSVGGPAEIDTVELALLGAAERDIVVVAAAGNQGDKAYAAHPGPWVTTVGGSTGSERRGRATAIGGPNLTGAMSSDRAIGPAKFVIGARVPAVGQSAADARVCAPGSLDAARVQGAVVLCERGQVGRVDKSHAVKLADGVGMVLINEQPGSVDADFHEVPTVHLDATSGKRLFRWIAQQSSGRISLRPLGIEHGKVSVARWSSSGSPTGPILKPDLIAAADGVLAAAPRQSGLAWSFTSGTSPATAQVAGIAAALLSRHEWTAPDVRSALATTSGTVRTDTTLHSGAGRVRQDRADNPGLLYRIDRLAFRDWLDGDDLSINTPSVLLTGGTTVARRTVTNVSSVSRYFSAKAIGFRRNVTVRPAALRLEPGERGTFTVRTPSTGGRLDDGYISWRGATGTITRIPVVVSR